MDLAVYISRGKFTLASREIMKLEESLARRVPTSWQLYGTYIGR